MPRWSLGLWVSRAYYKTPEEAIAVAQMLRQRRIPCDVLTLDGRAAWKVETRFNFEWDPERFADPRASLAAIRAQHLKVCVWEYPYVSVHAPLFVELAQRRATCSRPPRAIPTCSAGTLAPGSSPFGNVLTPLPESGIVDFTNPEAYAWWRDAHEKLFADGVDVIKSDFGEHVPDDAVAYNGDWGRRLHNVYPLLYNRCVYEATRKFQPSEDEPAASCGAARAGRAASGIRWAGAATRRATGRASPPRCAAACRWA